MATYDALVGNRSGIVEEEAHGLVGRHVARMLQQYAAQNMSGLDLVLEAAGLTDEDEVQDVHRDLNLALADEVEAQESHLVELVFNFLGSHGDRVLSRTVFEALLTLTVGLAEEDGGDQSEDPTAQQAKALFALMDSDLSGTVSQQEALVVLKHAVQTTVKLATILVDVLHKVLVQELLGRLVVEVAKVVDEDGDGEISLTELSGFVKQATETVQGNWEEGSSGVASLCRFIKRGRGLLSPQCKSDIKGLHSEAKMFADILTAMIASESESGMTKEVFVSHMGDCMATHIDLFFKMVPPLPDSAYSERLLPLRPRVLELLAQLKAKLSSKHQAISEAFFDMIDRDLSGSVTAREFTSAVKLMDLDSPIDAHVEVFFEIVDKDQSNALDPSELIEVAELAVAVVAVAVKCFVDAASEALEEGAMDQLLLEIIAQYVGESELTEADSTQAFEDFTADSSRLMQSILS